MAVRLMLIFNIFSCTVLSQINGQHTTAVLHPTPTTSIPMDNTSRNATTRIPDSVSKAKVEQNNRQHNGTIGDKLSSTASERSTSSTTTNVTTMPVTVSTSSATTNITMPVSVSTSSATTNVTTMPVSVSTSSATTNITMPATVSVASATTNVTTMPATVSTSSATTNITMPATVSTSSATMNVPTMPATVSTSSATTNVTTMPATVSTSATTNITMPVTVPTSSATTNITVSASLATTNVTTVPATVLNIRTESSSVIMKEETSTGSPSSALPVKATPLQTSVKPDVSTEGATSTRTIQNENTSPSMPVSGETFEKVRMSTSSRNNLVPTNEPSSSSNNPTPTSQTSGTATSMRPATFPNTSPSQPYASALEERTTTVTTGTTGTTVTTGTRGAARPKARPDTNTFPDTTQLTQSVRNDRVMAVVEENGVNATASKMSKESVEEKEDRQLFYIAMGILGGTAVLVLAVAVITYFTHRELPARVDIRKFTSYTSSA